MDHEGHPLDERKKRILRAVVDDYVSSCEPVGSKALLQRHALGVSSATVRNEMAELEALGYLEQPHTSAGRIPSDKGYRAYVDELLTLDMLSMERQERYTQGIASGVRELSSLIKNAAATLAEQTNYTSLLLSPRYGMSKLKQVKILMIEPGRALVVVVLSAGVVRDRLIRVPQQLNAAELQVIASAIESKLQGQKLEQISMVTVQDAGQTEQIPEQFLNQVLYEAYVAIKQAEQVDVYMEGAHRMLQHPEFSDVGKAHRFLDAIHQDGLVAGYFGELEDQKAPQKERPAYVVRIGQEIKLAGLEECSFVSSSYRVGKSVLGRIAVVGPRRMQYAKIISDIRFVKQTLARELQKMIGAGPKPLPEGEEQDA